MNEDYKFFLCVIVIVLAFFCVLIVFGGNNDTMTVCQLTHSYDTCFSTLNR